MKFIRLNTQCSVKNFFVQLSKPDNKDLRLHSEKARTSNGILLVGYAQWSWMDSNTVLFRFLNGPNTSFVWKSVFMFGSNIRLYRMGNLFILLFSIEPVLLHGVRTKRRLYFYFDNYLDQMSTSTINQYLLPPYTANVEQLSLKCRLKLKHRVDDV